MIITHKKGLKLNGKIQLYCMDMVGLMCTPSFRIQNAVWMEQGGIYAVPNLRGGGNMVKNGTRQETKLQKQMFLMILSQLQNI